ncbi:MAG: hypothetical protein HBSAPP02_23820 [Phycisphaerae bacterium]|nr:MAG: hypothetical protein HBSAPP02_23820 [Phycisphaerae bacterium]
MMSCNSGEPATTIGADGDAGAVVGAAGADTGAADAVVGTIGSPARTGEIKTGAPSATTMQHMAARGRKHATLFSSPATSMPETRSLTVAVRLETDRGSFRTITQASPVSPSARGRL